MASGEDVDSERFLVRMLVVNITIIIFCVSSVFAHIRKSART